MMHFKHFFRELRCSLPVGISLLFFFSSFSSFAQQDCCDEGEKPASITFTFTGEDCSATNSSQKSDKIDCSGDPNFDSSVYIVVEDSKGKETYFTGTVDLDDEFTISAANAGKDKFKAETIITIYSSQGGNVIQELEIHTSCSQPLIPGEQVGSARIEGVTYKNGTSCGDPGDPIDPPTGSDCCDQGNKPVLVTFQYTGQSCSETNTSQKDDKFECSGDANDDPLVYIVATDKKGDDILFAGTIALGENYSVSNGGKKLDSETLITVFASQGGAVLQELNIHTSCSAPLVPGENIGSALIEGVVFEDGTSCGTTVPPVDPPGGSDCCDQGNKPVLVTFQYTGQSCSETNTSQKDDKFECSGDANDDPLVYIVATDKKGDDILFAGTIALGENYSVSNGGKKLDSETLITVFASQGGAVLQELNIHTSCSAPLVPGENIGSALIEGVVFEDGTSCGTTVPPVDPPGGSDCCDQGNKPVLVTFQYTGQSCSETNTSQKDDKFECSGDANDDPLVYIVATGKDGDDILFTGEVALGESYSVSNGGDKLDSETLITIFASQGGATLQELNIHTSCSAPLVPGENIGSALIEGVVFEDGTSCGTTEPPVDPQGGTDCCDEGNKPRKVTFTYTGEGCSATNTSQDDGKFECDGDPNGDPSVYIIATGKKDDDIIFQGNVSINSQFTVDAALMDEDKLDSETLITVYSSQGGTLLQEINVHTSCSAPLVPGENIGSARIEVVEFEDGTTCGEIPELPCLGDFVWEDLDRDGTQDIGEPGVANITVELYQCTDGVISNTKIAETVTNTEGFYEFCDLQPGEYAVRVVEIPDNFSFCVPNQGDDAIDSDVDPATGFTNCVMVDEVDVPTVDIGIKRELPCLGDFVWEDLNQNGVQDAGEPGVPNITIELYQCFNGIISNTKITETISNSEGFYEFCDLIPGEYAVRVVEIPTDFTFCVPDQGDDALDSDVDPATGFTNCVMVDEVDVPTVDIGIKKPPVELPCLGDFVWEDLNQNGIQDAGEPGVQGVTLKLFLCENGGGTLTMLAETVTDSRGFYEFCDLEPGDYAVEVVEIPTDFSLCVPDQGGDDAKDSDVDPATGFTNCVTVEDLDVPTVDIGIKEGDCIADAGSLTPDITDDICFDELPLTLSATPNGDAEVPAGYAIAYLLTEGENLLIEAVADDPSFFVNVARKPTCCIHTLVFDPDPNSEDFLDLSMIRIGVTKAKDVYDTIVKDGLCADLDLDGACFNFIDCEDPTCETTNLAKGKPSMQSSTYGYGYPGFAVDGNTSGSSPWGNADLQHTKKDENAWWSVDLGEVCEIESIKIFNRSNGYQNRLRNFYILVSDKSFASDDLDATLADPNVQATYVANAPKPMGEYAIEGKGRYVRIQLKGRNFLHMSEVMILGCKKSSKTHGFGNGSNLVPRRIGLGQLTVGPNPISKSFTVQFDDRDIQMEEITIMNAVGQVIEIKKVDKGAKEVRFDSGSWANGVYLMKVSYGNQTETVKLIKN